MAMNVTFKKGLAASYAAITTKDANTFYYLTDTKALYLGGNLIGNGVSLESFNALVTRMGTTENKIASIENTLKSIATTTDLKAVKDRLDTAESDIDELQSKISGLTGAMHFRGVVSTLPAAPLTGYNAGDVVILSETSKEYVCVESSGTKTWRELGDEGSHALKEITIKGAGYLEGGGDLSANRTIDITSAVKAKIDNGATAYGWGNHASAGYLKTHQDISGKADKVKSAVANNFASLDANGNLKDSGKKAADFATAEAIADMETKTNAAAIYATKTSLAATEKNAQTGITNAATAQAKANDAYTLAGTKTTLDEAKNAIQGDTTNTVRECVDAINKLNNTYTETQKDISGAIENVVAQLTWSSF